MAVDLDLFAGSNFRSTIASYCNANGWKINEINDRRAIIKFDMDSGTTQTLFIIKYESTLEFSVPSGVKFSDKDDIPGWLSTTLMLDTANYKVGFWCIEKISEKYTYSIMHNADMSLLNAQYFGSVVSKLVAECDKLEQSIQRALNS